MPRLTLWILAAWFILGPLFGIGVSFATGEAHVDEILFGTAGGLLGGLLHALIGEDDGALTVLATLVGAVTLMLFYDGLAGLLGLDTSLQ